MFTPEVFRREVQEYLSTHPSGLLDIIPAGSGICRIANVSPEEYRSDYVSPSPGRWNVAGKPTSYFAQDFQLCMSELGYTSNNPPSGCVFELCESTEQLNVVNVTKLPEPLQSGIYIGQSGLGKWDMAHIFLDELQKCADYSDVKGVYAPSASGQLVGHPGACLASWSSQNTRIIATGSYQDFCQPPGPSLDS